MSETRTKLRLDWDAYVENRAKWSMENLRPYAGHWVAWSLDANYLGIDLSIAVSGSGESVGGISVPVRYAYATIRIADSHERREWRAWVGFIPVRLRRSLFGFGGFLQHVSALFGGDHEFVELTVNRLYSGNCPSSYETCYVIHP